MFLIQTNGRVRPGIRYITRRRAEGRKPAWERHYAEAGMKLETFEVVPFNVMDPAHHYGNGRTLVIQGDGSADFADAKAWDKRTNRWAADQSLEKPETPNENQVL